MDHLTFKKVKNLKIFSFIPLLFLTCLSPFQSIFEVVENQNPLGVYNELWNKPLYEACNTGKNTPYLSNREKDILYVLNLIRQYPQQFTETVLGFWPEKQGTPKLRQTSYFISLVEELSVLSPKAILTPDSLAWVSARCHAISSGKNSYTGHERQSTLCTQQKYFHAECCHYGFSDPVEIILSLLIDEGVPSLGHRKVMLDDQYKKVGVSFAPHKKYENNTVLNFLR